MLENNNLNITDFFNASYCDYGMYDNLRKISNIIDGNKISSRKCLYIVLKDNIKDAFKVQNLCTRVSEKTNYIHGATSLYGVIVGMAQDFVGTNNIPLFKRKGNFGSRLIPEASADRYIFTCKEDYLTNIFMEADNELLISQEFEGDIIEPKYFVPIIPMLLVNGSIGLTTGFSQKILPRNPKELIKWIECKLTNKRFTGKLLPYYKNFTGTIVPTSDCSFDIIGKYEKISANKIEITDLPCGPGTGGYSDLNSYLSILDKLVDEKKIKDYDDYSEANNYKIIVTFWRNQGLDIDTCDIIKELKLSKSVTECYTSLNEDNKVIEYKSVKDILENYFNVRYDYYVKRKELLMKKITDKILQDVSKYTFIKGVIDQEILINNKSAEQIEKQLTNIKNIIKINDSYDYLLNMPIYNITKERYLKLKESLKNLKTELKELKELTPESMWLSDLTTLNKFTF